MDYDMPIRSSLGVYEPWKANGYYRTCSTCETDDMVTISRYPAVKGTLNCVNMNENPVLLPVASGNRIAPPQLLTHSSEEASKRKEVTRI